MAEAIDIRELNERIERQSAFVTNLMTGMDQMSAAVKPLKDVPEFTNILLMFSNPILGMIAGLVLTAIIQSSSASVGCFVFFWQREDSKRAIAYSDNNSPVDCYGARVRVGERCSSSESLSVDFIVISITSLDIQITSCFYRIYRGISL